MSRTIRRTHDKRRNKSGRSYFEDSYTFEYVEEWNGTTPHHGTCGAFPSVKLKGKEFKKAWWKFHGDTKPGYGWGNHQYDRKRFEDRCRMKNKEEIIRYYKDEEHEVFTHQPGCLSYER